MEQCCPEILNKPTVARDKRFVAELPSVDHFFNCLSVEKVGTDEANFGYAMAC